MVYHLLLLYTIVYTKWRNPPGTAIEGRRSLPSAEGLALRMLELFNFAGKGATRMDVIDLITVISFGLTCFIAGYELGKSYRNAKK